MDKDMWLGVLERTILDLRGDPGSWDTRTRNSRKHQAELERAKREAIMFSGATDGPWAQSRGDVCHAAGVDPDAFREYAIKEGLVDKKLLMVYLGEDEKDSRQKGR